MITIRLLAAAVMVLLLMSGSGCQALRSTAETKVQVDESEVEGFKLRTYFGADGTVRATVASDGKTTFVAIPTAAFMRQKKMSDEEFKCLKKCENEPDLDKKTTCRLSCPVTKRYNLFVYK